MKKIIIPAIILVLILFSGIWVLGRFNKPAKEAEIIPTPTQVMPTVTDDVKVELEAVNNNRQVILRISGLTPDMESVEYELTYITGEGLPRGVLGKISLSGESEVERDDIVLGTCSSGRCVYDAGVESIDLTLKFNAGDKVSVFQKTYDL